MRRLTTPVESESADIEAGCTPQGTSALEAEGKGEIKSQALQGAEDKAKLVSDRNIPRFLRESHPRAVAGK